MANALIGSHPSHGFKVVEQLDSNIQLTRSDSGKLYFVDQPDTHAFVSLPKLSSEIAGWHAKFILRSLGTSGDFHIKAFGDWEESGTTGDADTVQILEVGPSKVGIEDADSVQFYQNAETEGAVIEVMTDGSNWYALGYAKNASDVYGDG